MSDDWIILIPEDARTVPASEKQAAAVKRFRELAPAADEIEIETTEQIRFVDCGANFTRVLCPKCGRDLEIEWWQERMDEDYDGSGFRLNLFKLPCCQAACTLNELTYDWTQGFTRFSLEAMNPSIGELPKNETESFAGILGCPLKVIFQHI